MTRLLVSRDMSMSSVKVLVVYLLVGLASLAGPTLTKIALSGSAGMYTFLLGALVVAPTGFFLLGLYYGRGILAIHAVVFIVINALAFFTWLKMDINPWKDFAHAYEVAYAWAFAVACVLHIASKTKGPHQAALRRFGFE